MNYKKSSYFRFFRFSLLALISALILAGAVTLVFGTRFFRSEKLEQLKNVGQTFVSTVRDRYSSTGNLYDDGIRAIHKSICNNYDVVLTMYDENGNCIIAPEGSDFKPLDKKLINTLDKDDYLDIDSDKFSKDAPSVVFASQFYVKQGENSPLRLYLTAVSEPGGINMFILKMVIVLMIIGGICVYVFYTLFRKRVAVYAKHEADFLRISEQYSKGDFSEKLSTEIGGSVGESAKYVNSLAANVESREDTSKTFIANVSHELRTPITSIGGFVDGMLDGTIPKSRHQEYLVLVSKEIKRLRILISSMLNMTRFESGTLKPNFKETNLTDLVIQTVLMFEKKIEDKNIEIEGLDSDRLMAVVDADLIQQVIYNLVENAVKFVNTKGTISFSFEKNSDGICTVSVRNTGEGLKNTEIQQVFDRFYKTDSSRGKDTTGLGLGLSISRKIVHLHNGHIVVKSVYGEYTEFSVQIPDKQS